MRQRTKIRGLRDILACAIIAAAITMPSALTAQPLPSEDQWVVVIDAGHGGKDPGAVGAKGKEKHINLAVALKTGKYITDNMKDVKVIYTRDDDTYPGLAERAEIANKNKADLFISIHSNALTDKRLYGAETYVLGQTMDDANLQVAMKENSVITLESDYQTKYEGFDPNSAESYIIFSLMQNTYLKQSTEFATLVQGQFRDRVGRKDRGVRQAGFVVLWRTTMPSVLVELGYITNPEEEKFLLSEQGQDYLASAIYRAFRDYKQTIDSRSGIRNGNGVAAGQAATSGKPDTSAAGNAGKPDTSAAGNAGKPDTSAAGNAGKTAANAPENTTNQVKAALAGTGKPDNAVPVASVKTEPGAVTLKDGAIPASARESDATASADATFFMVQVAAMPAGRELSQNQLKGIETVTRIHDGERTKYAAGKYVLYDDALKYRRTLTGRFPDAFVIAVRNGKIVPLREAIEAQKRKQ
jgi:N-acetylmuramoyl-L-alanine amidase